MVTTGSVIPISRSHCRQDVIRSRCRIDLERQVDGFYHLAFSPLEEELVTDVQIVLRPSLQDPMAHVSVLPDLFPQHPYRKLSHAQLHQR